MKKNKLYVLIDKNLDPIYGGVQGGHAVAAWVIENYDLKRNNDWNITEPIWTWNNDYLIYLSVDIKKWYDKLKKYDPSKFQWTWFEEPDLGNKMTAIAVYANGFPSRIKNELQKEELLI